MNLPLKDIGERALSSAGEQFLVVILAAGSVLSLAGLPWKFALATSAGAFIISALLSIAQFSVGGVTVSYWADIAIRVVKTFAASLLATMTAGTDALNNVVDVTTVPWLTALNVSALAAFVTLVKCVLAGTGRATGASLLRHPAELANPVPPQ